MSGLKKILIGIVVAFIAVNMLLIMFVGNLLNLVDGLKPNGIISSAKTYDIRQTEIYKATKSIDEEYLEIVKQQMITEKQNLVEANTYEVTEIDESTGKEVKKKKCDIVVKRIYNHINYADLIAYLQMTGGLDDKTATIDHDKAMEFINSISKIEITQISEKKYEIQNAFLTADQIADKFFTKQTQKSKYTSSCYAYGMFLNFAESSAIKNDDSEEQDVQDDVYNVSLLEIPLYLQYSGSWASTPYGNGTIKNKGCAPTCLAMVLSYMKQQQILPSDIVAWTGNRYYVNGAGSSWDIFTAVAGNWGVNCKMLGHSQSNMMAALSTGKPVIASMGPGEFTKGGHFIVLTGLTEDGKIKVCDPNDSAKKNHKGTNFDMGLIMRESKCFWSFE